MQFIVKVTGGGRPQSVISRQLFRLEDTIRDRDKLEILAKVFLEPAEVLLYELEKELVRLEVICLAVGFSLFFLDSVLHYQICYRLQAGYELLEAQSLPRAIIEFISLYEQLT